MKSWVNALKVFQRPIGSDECKIFSALLLDTSAFESQKMSFRIAKGEQSRYCPIKVCKLLFSYLCICKL